MTERLALGSCLSFITPIATLIFIVYYFLSSGLDSTKFKPNTQVILPNINDHGFWECDMDALIVNDRNFELDDQSAILDTGRMSACLFLPKSIKWKYTNRHHIGARPPRCRPKHSR